jgi:hypothetical protein
MTKYTRSNTVVREADDSAKPRRRTTPPAIDEAVATRQNNGNDTALRNWLERVEDRFMGTPTDIHPLDGLNQAIRITWGEVRYCDEQIRKLHEDELFERPLSVKEVEMGDGLWSVEQKRDTEQISRWQQLRATSVERLARFSKMALDVGLEERQMQLAEREATMIARYFEAVMGDLDLTEEQRSKLGPSMRKHLSVVESTATDVTGERN